MRIKLDTTVVYNNVKNVAGSIVNVKQEDLDEMQKYGVLLDQQQVLPFDNTNDSVEADLSEEIHPEVKVFDTEPKKPVKRNTGARKATTRKTVTKK